MGNKAKRGHKSLRPNSGNRILLFLRQNCILYLFMLLFGGTEWGFSLNELVYKSTRRYKSQMVTRPNFTK